MLAKEERKPLHIAMFSGGASSAYVAYRMVQQNGLENSVLFFMFSYLASTLLASIT